MDELGTFIMPTGSRKPSLFRDPGRRLRLEWHRAMTRVGDLIGWVCYVRAECRHGADIRCDAGGIITRSRSKSAPGVNSNDESWDPRPKRCTGRCILQSPSKRESPNVPLPPRSLTTTQRRHSCSLVCLRRWTTCQVSCPRLGSAP